MASTTILSDNGVSSGSAGIKTTGGNDGVLALQTTTSGGTATTAVTIDTSQNVGIGTSSPQARLHSYTNETTPAYLQANASSVYLRFGNNNSTNGYIGYEGAGGTNMTFWTNNTERARIDSSGNLLVGATTSTGGKVESKSGSAGGECYRSWNATDSGTRYFHYFGVGSASFTNVGAITSNGSTTTYATSSDYRLKENVQPMTGALAKVAALKPCTYTWTGTQLNDEGFIAHELAEVCPSAVIGEKDAVDADGNPVYQGIDTSFLVATLTAAIQEQQALITSLTERITALEAK